ncbi:MAG: hypothetical protein RR672_07310, partial [Raoultibacter sp.]
REPIMRTATAHFQGNPTSFDSVVNSANWSKTRVEQLNTVLEQRGVDISERYLRYCIDLYPAIEGYAVRQWLAKPPVISPKEAAENLITCVPRPLYEALCDD